MRQGHIAYIVESEHGHIHPTLPVASKLVERGYRVSYAVKDYFADRVVASGAQAIIYHPLESKLAIFRELQNDGPGEFPFDFNRADRRKGQELMDAEVQDTFRQLQTLYRCDKPDLIIYDVCNLGGRSLAEAWHIPAIEHSPLMIDLDSGHQYNDNLVIISLPAFFQRNAASLDSRFHFVGPVYNDGRFFKPWNPRVVPENLILVSATTGLLPQPEYFSTAIRAFKDTPFNVILSIGQDLDPKLLGPLPGNFDINQFSSQQQILQQCCLFVGHGGTSSIFEALRFGVPLLLSPPCQVHDVYAHRIAELGLGVRIAPADFSAERLRSSAMSVLEDKALLSRVKAAQKVINESNGPERAADLITQYMSDVVRLRGSSRVEC
jgi:UDP:flavonoid glycosyltransferase YjiC (YdhE family)